MSLLGIRLSLLEIAAVDHPPDFPQRRDDVRSGYGDDLSFTCNKNNRR